MIGRISDLATEGSEFLSQRNGLGFRHGFNVSQLGRLKYVYSFRQKGTSKVNRLSADRRERFCRKAMFLRLIVLKERRRAGK